MKMGLHSAIPEVGSQREYISEIYLNVVMRMSDNRNAPCIEIKVQATLYEVLWRQPLAHMRLVCA